jgi:PAS domain S-box-containing protein
VIHEGRTIRVKEISADPRSAGFPAQHPPMHTFLGGPLMLGKEVYGNFYLTEKEGGGEFTEEDERLLEGLVQQASLTIAYARETNDQRRLLDAVLRQTPQGILFYASDGQVAFSNSAAEAMLGHGADGDSAGVQVSDAEGRPLEHESMPAARALRGEPVADSEVRVMRPGQAPLPCLVSAAPVYTETGTLLGAVVALQDISALKELERVREEFAAVVAHDLRNPVQAIMMQAQLLQRMAQGESVVAPVSALERVLRNGERLMLLIDDLLDVSRIERRRVYLERREVELPAAISQLLKQTEITLGDHQAELRIEGTPPAVFVDPMRLDQVLTNLIQNAAKYSEPGKPIEITVEPSGHGAQITVKDSGAGIAREDLPRLFDRYFQTKRAREKKSGIGLGLFITKGLVEAHGGRLTVESELGQGSAFRVWLPAHSDARSCEACPEEESAAAQGL